MRLRLNSLGTPPAAPGGGPSFLGNPPAHPPGITHRPVTPDSAPGWSPGGRIPPLRGTPLQWELREGARGLVLDPVYLLWWPSVPGESPAVSPPPRKVPRGGIVLFFYPSSGTQLWDATWAGPRWKGIPRPRWLGRPCAP